MPVHSYGYSGSLFAERVWAKNAIRARAEFVSFGDKSEGGIDTSAKTWGLMGDYIYGFNSSDRGIYVLAGVGYFRLSTKVGLKDRNADAMTDDFVASTGLGWNFNKHFGVETKFTRIFCSGDPADFAQLGLKIRF